MQTTFKNDRPFTKSEVKSSVVLFTVATILALAIEYAATGDIVLKVNLMGIGV